MHAHCPRALQPSSRASSQRPRLWPTNSLERLQLCRACSPLHTRLLLLRVALVLLLLLLQLAHALIERPAPLVELLEDAQLIVGLQQQAVGQCGVGG